MDSFNHYFACIGKDIQTNLGVDFTFEPSNKDGEFNFKEVDKKSVEKLIDRIKPKVATGYDQIPSKIIKDLKQEASTDLVKLINLSYRTSIFPDKLKHAVIKAIYKKRGIIMNLNFTGPSRFYQ